MFFKFLFIVTKIINTFATTEKIPIPFCDKKKYLLVCVEKDILIVIDDENNEIND